MTKYNYKAINTLGRSVRGVVDAMNEIDLYEQLQRAGMELVSCNEIKEGRQKFAIPLPGRGVKVRDLIQIFVHLEQTQTAGVPLLTALNDVRASCENQKLRDAMTTICEAVSNGAALSEAMSNYSDIFQPLYISLVRAGESTGDLTFAYRQLIKYLKWLDNMQRMIKKATRYPTILAIAVVVVMTVMMTIVVPQITAFVEEDMNIELPFITTTLIATKDFFIHYWWFILITPVAVFFGIRTAMRTSESFAFFMDKTALRMPIMGNLIRKISVARYAQTFGAMFAAGINVIKALRSAGETITNRVLAKAVLTIEQKVREGESLSFAFNESGEFPSLVIQMLKVGEETGNLKVVLDQISDFYIADVNDTIDSMMTAIEPLLISVMGGLMLWIAAGSLWPIYSNLGTLVESVN